MAENLNQTPNANRLHIGFFGKRNSGKSSLINQFVCQEVSIVSDYAGTTTDPVYKAMEINPLGACVIIDTAGFDDVGELGEIRVEKTKLAAEKTELAVIVCSDTELSGELNWYTYFKKKNTPVLFVVNKVDVQDGAGIVEAIQNETGLSPLLVSAKTGQGIEQLKPALARLLPEDYGAKDITGSLVQQGDLVLLVMPQDIQAPKGRLILPQVQTIRELLDKKALVMSVTTDQLDAALASLQSPPKLIITDSQVFRYVYERKPQKSLLTSFSVLFAAHKGDIQYYLEGAKAIGGLSESSKVLIAECCTHAPLSEDIGRVKIPNLLRKRFGQRLDIQMVSGTDFPQDLTPYDLIIQCGACMFNRKYVLSRIDRAKKQDIPMTNYGVTIAYLTGILDDITIPE
ncbi:[FeFe] hydrogenase H-cluster maturation GTPase HydF [Massilioclostridium coli]|uniref:[FeFe] hydrogenase H-cluster maturation GTPase HydF n=1 Tax=Massilioclostridium coli TaxID=1870991 RepID=UPI0022E225B8|nr:[FeFe] hydrogenase H-cluster maturation GTPase HydF [Massilioclostridium coli]